MTAVWDERKHPRVSAGDTEGGRFTNSEGGSNVRNGRRRPVVSFSETTDPGEFRRALAGNTRAWNLTEHTDAEFVGNRMFLSEDGLAGFQIDETGDLQNVFRNPGGVKGAGRAAVERAILEGAVTLDAYDGFLPKMYAELGFAEIGRMRFDPELAPAGVEGQPDVVFMALGAVPVGGRYYDDWDLAKVTATRAARPLAVAAAGWDESKYRRHPAGDDRGGEFAPKAGGVTWLETPQHEEHAGEPRVPWIYSLDTNHLYVGSPGGDHAWLSEVMNAKGDQHYEGWRGVWLPGKATRIHSDEQGNEPDVNQQINPVPQQVVNSLARHLGNRVIFHDEGSVHDLLASVAFDPLKHPKVPAGSSTGGQWATKQGEVAGFPEGVFGEPGDSVYFWPKQIGQYSGFSEDKEGPMWKALTDPDGNEVAFWFADQNGFPHHATVAKQLGVFNSLHQWRDFAGYGMSYSSEVRFPGDPEGPSPIAARHRRDIADAAEMAMALSASAAVSLRKFNRGVVAGVAAAAAVAPALERVYLSLLRAGVRDAADRFRAQVQEWDVTAAGFDPLKHPRHPGGDSRGGEWAPKYITAVIPAWDTDFTGDVNENGEYVDDPRVLQFRKIRKDLATWPQAELMGQAPEDATTAVYMAFTAVDQAEFEGEGLVTVEKDGRTVGVVDYMEGENNVIGGFAGAIDGSGLRLFDGLLGEAARLGKGLSFSGTEESHGLYDRFGIPKRDDGGLPGEYRYLLARDEVERLNEDMFAYARFVTASAWVPPDPGDLVDTGEMADAAKVQTAKARKRMLKAMLVALDLDFEITNPFALELLDQLGRFAGRLLVPGLQQAVAGAVAQGYAEGLSVPHTAELIEQAGVESRATMMARTDLTGLTNGASVAAARAVYPDGTVLKRWLSAHDDRVRPDHVEADGQTVPIEQPFIVGADELMFPGDPTGSDGETCNCRCTTVYVPVAAVTAAGWDESQHPRDPGGEGGGQFIPRAAVEEQWQQARAQYEQNKAQFKEMQAQDEIDFPEMESDFRDYMDLWADEQFNTGGQDTIPEDWRLGHTNDPEVVAQVDQSILESSGLSEDTAIYTGRYGDPPGDRPWSGSLSKYIATSYADRTGRGKEDHLRRVLVPAGTKVGWSAAEQELVFPSGSSLEPAGGDLFIVRVPPQYVEPWVTAAGWVEEEHPRDPGGDGGGEFIGKGEGADGGSEVKGGPPMAAGDTLEDQLRTMGAYEMEQGQDRHPERFMKHPKSGFMVEKPGVVWAEEMAPELDDDGWGRQPPRIRDVVEGEGFGLPPGYTDADVEAGRIEPLGYGKFQVGVPRPPKYLFRAVSEAEWQQALERGFMQTDGRMNLTDTEGTVTAFSDPSYYLPGKLASDKPGLYEGRVLRIKYADADGWRHDRDGYVKTSKPVPIGRVDMVTSKLRREVFDTGKGYADFGPMEPVTAAGWDESKHPRNPATGADGQRSPGDGGKFRAKDEITPVEWMTVDGLVERTLPKPPKLIAAEELRSRMHELHYGEPSDALIERWGEWTPEERLQMIELLKHDLREGTYSGLLSVSYSNEIGMSFAKERGQARTLLRQLERTDLLERIENGTAYAEDYATELWPEKKPKAAKVDLQSENVPAAYLSESGKFRPGYDAKYKSDLVNSAVGMPTKEHVFTPEEARARLEARGWTKYLTARERKMGLVVNFRKPDGFWDFVTTREVTPELAGKLAAMEKAMDRPGGKGSRLTVKGMEYAVIQTRVSDLALLHEAHPDILRGLGQGAGQTVWIGPGSGVDQDDLGHLSGEQARGWRGGATMKGVPGFYVPSEGKVAIGTGTNNGSASITLHEVAHSIDQTYNVKFMPEMYEFHRELYPLLGNYYKQGGRGGDAGRSELWAESVASLLKYDEAVAAGQPTSSIHYPWNYTQVPAQVDALEEYSKWVRATLKGINDGVVDAG